MQNTTLLLSFVLRTTKRFFKSPLIGSTLALLGCLCLQAQTIQLPVGLQYSTVWYVAVQPPQPLDSQRLSLSLSFRTTTLSYYLPPFYGRDLLSDCSESSLTLACLDGLLRAAVYGKPAFGVVTYLTLMDAKPPISTSILLQTISCLLCCYYNKSCCCCQPLF